MAFKHTNSKGTDYYLYGQEITLKGSGKKQRIFYFSKKDGGDHSLDSVPGGYIVVESQKTGLPVLKRG